MRAGGNMSLITGDSPSMVGLEMAIAGASAVWLLASTLLELKSNSVSGK